MQSIDDWGRNVTDYSKGNEDNSERDQYSQLDDYSVVIDKG